MDYEFALRRIEELLPIVTDEIPITDEHIVELTMVSDIVESYEKNHFPIGKLFGTDMDLSERQLTSQIRVSLFLVDLPQIFSLCWYTSNVFEL